MSRQVITYIVDPGDRICHVDHGWTRFALENGAPALTHEAVIGSSLWQYITGDDTKCCYKKLLARIRETRRTHQYHFRCDSPERLRVYEMFMTPLGDGRVHFESCLMLEKPRVPLRLISPVLVRAEGKVLICSICMKVQVAPADWRELEDADEVLARAGDDAPPLCIYDLCPTCPDRLIAA